MDEMISQSVYNTHASLWLPGTGATHLELIFRQVFAFFRNFNPPVEIGRSHRV